MSGKVAKTRMMEYLGFQCLEFGLPLDGFQEFIMSFKLDGLSPVLDVRSFILI